MGYKIYVNAKILISPSMCLQEILFYLQFLFAIEQTTRLA